MVECECKQNHGISIFFRVLIDTWWNVNSWQRMCDVVAATVLIDTWWNVNFLYFPLILPTYYSFNRYMVECEFWNSRDFKTNISVLIDTWWNVNSEKMKESARAGSVLIDTWWNVNTQNS